MAMTPAASVCFAAMDFARVICMLQNVRTQDVMDKILDFMVVDRLVPRTVSQTYMQAIRRPWHDRMWTPMTGRTTMISKQKSRPRSIDSLQLMKHPSFPTNLIASPLCRADPIIATQVTPVGSMWQTMKQTLTSTSTRPSSITLSPASNGLLTYIRIGNGISRCSRQVIPQVKTDCYSRFQLS